MTDSNESGSNKAWGPSGAPQRLRTVLFLCTANYYRSRLSELLFRFHAERLGLDWDTDSKGILDRMRGMGLSPTATRYLEKLELGEMAKMPREPAVASLEDIMETHL